MHTRIFPAAVPSTRTSASIAHQLLSPTSTSFWLASGVLVASSISLLTFVAFHGNGVSSCGSARTNRTVVDVVIARKSENRHPPGRALSRHATTLHLKSALLGRPKGPLRRGFSELRSILGLRLIVGKIIISEDFWEFMRWQDRRVKGYTHTRVLIN